MTIRTRFAPSPTGYLHIGGVRTALFNWLFTRRHGGQFVLRIDDTDAERNREEALQPILDGFRWLGIDWDEGPEVGGDHGPYFQSQRSELYAEAATRLLESGHAYPDYMGKEELDAERKAAEEAKKAYVHRGPLRDAPPAENLKRYRDEPTTLRFKVPAGQAVVIDDLIGGRCEQRTDLLGDPVIVRQNGRPLYNFATVVDDVAMKITHVIRAKEHLSNTYTQALFYDALGDARPAFAHVPVVNEPNSKKKLSKRDMKKFVTAEVRAKLHAVGYTDEEIDQRDDLNPATVAFYRELGYLPQGLINYLGRLGWSLDDHTEFMTLGQMVENFGLDRVNDSPASFDPDKLYWLAGEHMRQLPEPERSERCVPFLQRAGLASDPITGEERTKLDRVVAACGDRIKLSSDVLTYGAFFFRADPVYEQKAVDKKLKKPEARELLLGFVPVLRDLEPFELGSLEAALHDYCAAKGAKNGPLIHALRVSTTGTEVGPGVFDCLAILGRDEVLRRIDMALKLA